MVFISWRRLRRWPIQVWIVLGLAGAFLLLFVRTLERRHAERCYPTEAELVDYPNCFEKWARLMGRWEREPCLALFGVDGSVCSFRRYLSITERHCPPMEGTNIMEGRVTAQRNFSLEDLFLKLTGDPINLAFMKKRITRMWPSWKDAYRDSQRVHPQSMEKRTTLKIILHLGFLTETNFGKTSTTGGPLGELVQWSDLIASLHTLGHDIRISIDLKTLLKTIDSFDQPGYCPKQNVVDLIFTDILGLEVMQRERKAFVQTHKCKLRLLDTFGTQAAFNSKEYFEAHTKELGHKNAYGGHGLRLRQFLTLYPHTPDNTFLGFVVNTHLNASENSHGPSSRSGVLVYGKEKRLWTQAEKAVETIMKMTEVHATVADAAQRSSLPAGVINHGLLDEKAFHLLLTKVRIFLGLGDPIEGPAAIEAVAHGAIFINPRFPKPKGRLTDRLFEQKPTIRELTSQCPYLEEMGEPWVITLDTSNITALKTAVEKAMRTDVTPRLPSELTTAGMLLRVSRIVDRLDTCSSLPVYPPPRALKEKIGKSGDSCEVTCSLEGLRCDSALFPLINTEEKLFLSGMQCEEIDSAPALVNPSRCSLQQDPLLFSCSASADGVVRLCPCRDFIPDQKELCKDCL